jgi:hypothetical protein
VRQSSDAHPSEAAPQILLVSLVEEREKIGLDRVEFALPRSLRAVDVAMPEVEHGRGEQREDYQKIDYAEDRAEDRPVRKQRAVRQRDLIGLPQKLQRPPTAVRFAVEVEIGAEHQPRKEHRDGGDCRGGVIAPIHLRREKGEGNYRVSNGVVRASIWHMGVIIPVSTTGGAGNTGAYLYCLPRAPHAPRGWLRY